jgi:hypothetical protein
MGAATDGRYLQIATKMRSEHHKAPIVIYHNFPSARCLGQILNSQFLLHRPPIQMIIINGFSGINVQKLPEKAHILRNDDFQFLRTAKELWLRITTTQITDLLPAIIPGRRKFFARG